MLGRLKEALARRRAPKPFAACEFWVYLRGDEMPPQDDLMRILLAENPHGARAFGKNEGLVLSDIRLHVGLVHRKKNPHAFRPDLFDTAIVPRAEVLTNLSESASFVKIRFVAEERLSSRHHIQALTGMADAVARMGDGTVVFDAVGERFFLLDELYGALQQDPNAARFDLQAQVMWKVDGPEGHAETRGLLKVGCPELVTRPVPVDQKVLATAVLEQAARQCWAHPGDEATHIVQAFDDEFELLLTPESSTRTHVRILRRQSH